MTDYSKKKKKTALKGSEAHSVLLLLPPKCAKPLNQVMNINVPLQALRNKTVPLATPLNEAKEIEL